MLSVSPVGSAQFFVKISISISRDFSLLVFFMNQFPPKPRVSHLDRFEFFEKFAEIFASQYETPVSTTPEQFATGSKLPPVSTTLAANLSPLSMTLQWQNLGTIYQAAETLK